MKKSGVFFLVLSVLAFGILMGCGGGGGASSSTGAAAAQKLLMSIVLSEDSQQGVYAKAFKSKLEELTEKRYDVQIVANEQLSGGDGPKTVEMLQQGAIDLDVHFNQMFIAQDERVGIVCLPFLFKSQDEVTAALNNGLADELSKIMYESVGVKVLGYGQAGFVNWASNKIFHSPADFKGVTMRCSNRLSIEIYSMYGASPVSLSANEVFTALQQGTSQAAYNFWMYVYDHHYYEVVKSITAGHTRFDLLTLSMNGKKYDALPANDQKLFLDAGKHAEDTFNAYVQQDDARMRAEIEKYGTTVYDLTPAEEAAFFEHGKKFFVSKRDVYGDALYAKAGIDIAAMAAEVAQKK